MQVQHCYHFEAHGFVPAVPVQQTTRACLPDAMRATAELSHAGRTAHEQCFSRPPLNCARSTEGHALPCSLSKRLRFKCKLGHRVTNFKRSFHRYAAHSDCIVIFTLSIIHKTQAYVRHLKPDRTLCTSETAMLIMPGAYALKAPRVSNQRTRAKTVAEISERARKQ